MPPELENENVLPTLLNQYMPSSENNDVTIKIRGNIATAIIKQQNGTVITQRMQQGLKEWTSFDPNTVSINERRKLVKSLINEKKMTQTEVSEILGVSQSLVSKDYRHGQK